MTQSNNSTPSPSSSPSPSSPELWLIRHGETEWSLSGAHTSLTDISLTERGKLQAQAVKNILRERKFDLILTSPLKRAIQTCKLSGYDNNDNNNNTIIIDDDLAEWNYGDLEGLTTPEIRAKYPDWTIWSGQIPNGEKADQVAHRVDRVINRALAVNGSVALFAHGHVLRVFGCALVESRARVRETFCARHGISESTRI